MRAREDTKEFISESEPISTPLNCEGAEKGRVVGRITRRSLLKLIIKELRVVEGATTEANLRNAERLAIKMRKDCQSAEVTVPFYELDRLSDPIIIGCPELKAWGFFLEPDLDDAGLGYVQFSKFGISIPLQGSRSDMHINVIHPALMAGPDFTPVEVRGVREEISARAE